MCVYIHIYGLMLDDCNQDHGNYICSNFIQHEDDSLNLHKSTTHRHNIVLIFQCMLLLGNFPRIIFFHLE